MTMASRKCTDPVSRCPSEYVLTAIPSDLIDVEPSNGDAYKMLLGSLLEPGWDERMNPADNFRDVSPTWGTYASSSDSVSHVLDIGQQTPRVTTLSTRRWLPEEYRSGGRSVISLTPSSSTLVASEAGDSSRASLALKSAERSATVNLSASRRRTKSRLSSIFTGRSGPVQEDV